MADLSKMSVIYHTSTCMDLFCCCRQHLGSFGIGGDLALQPMYTLSGGQKSRVAFAKVTFSKPHILLLDEPSNHLDLDAVNALIQVRFVTLCNKVSMTLCKIHGRASQLLAACIGGLNHQPNMYAQKLHRADC